MAEGEGLEPTSPKAPVFKTGALPITLTLRIPARPGGRASGISVSSRLHMAKIIWRNATIRALPNALLYFVRICRRAESANVRKDDRYGR